ncbi:MBL fold metallo-hydrolase [Frankia sp. ACN1ag]|uniref:MBL fold metallo-hydrolase n=1 Tax=Frankia sp. ACN1ag TaxID=102891 RepID=UPI0006DC9F40|nr:MBL fold metallo-hydrolase [Frankia sp. ACN1ag]KQC40028.1 hypothetical protein UK82_01675 [Frankia sp. ACN1ag]
MKVGDLNVQPVWDGDARVRARDVLTPPGGDEAHWECNAEHFTAAGEFEMALGGFLIRTGDQVVLVDAGLGPLSARGFHGGHLLDSLTALGVRPADVTDVLLTHLHGDHTGWTALEDRPVFPNATYRCHAADWHHFVDGPQPDRRTAAKLAPITGQVELFDTDLTLAPGIDARHTPGHTPGSTIFVVSSGQHRALLLGDVAHSPVELLDAGWETVYDTDSPAAQAARARLIDEIESDGTPVASPHFAGLRFGRVLAGTTSRRWLYLDH